MTTIAITPIAPSAGAEAKKRSPAAPCFPYWQADRLLPCVDGLRRRVHGAVRTCALCVSQARQPDLDRGPLDLPHHLEWSNYTTTLFQQDFIRYLGNTALVTVILTVGQVVFSVIAAYAFARLRFPGRDLIFWFYLVTLMIPNIVTIIPLYTIVAKCTLSARTGPFSCPMFLARPTRSSLSGSSS